jgi:hypothetical protein
MDDFIHKFNWKKEVELMNNDNDRPLIERIDTGFVVL